MKINAEKDFSQNDQYDAVFSGKIVDGITPQPPDAHNIELTKVYREALI